MTRESLMTVILAMLTTWKRWLDTVENPFRVK